MIPKVIKNEADYEAALARINELMDADPGTREGDELELLVTLVELYEKKAHPVGLPDPIEAIRFRMEQLGLKQKDLVTFYRQSQQGFRDSVGSAPAQHLYDSQAA